MPKSLSAETWEQIASLYIGDVREIHAQGQTMRHLGACIQGDVEEAIRGGKVLNLAAHLTTSMHTHRNLVRLVTRVELHQNTLWALGHRYPSVQLIEPARDETLSLRTRQGTRSLLRLSS